MPKNREEHEKSGYLTVKDFDPEFAIYRLGFPNKEVERGFTRFLSQQQRQNRHACQDQRLHLHPGVQTRQEC